MIPCIGEILVQGCARYPQLVRGGLTRANRHRPKGSERRNMRLDVAEFIAGRSGDPAAHPGTGRWLCRHPGFAMGDQNAIDEIRENPERRLRRLPMRRMRRVRKHRHVDRAIAFLLGDLDLPERPVVIVSALQDRHRNADIGEDSEISQLRNFGSSQAPFQP